MDKAKLKKLFEEVLMSYHDSEMMVIEERSVNSNDADELEKEIAEYRKEFNALLK